jgi:hypothetical protein
MKKLLTLLTFLISFACLNAQEKRHSITGKTALDSLAVSDVHIINQNTNIGTITNDIGFFEIPVKVGDTLFYSHLKYVHKHIVITESIISNKVFTIHLEEKIVTLKEIILEKQHSIFYQDPEIITYTGPVVTAKSLNLPYANSKIEKNEPLFTFRSGASISLGNLVSVLNGSKRREKLLKEMVLEDAELEDVRKYFTDDFFITDLKIEKNYINQFLNDCIDKNIIRIFKRDNKLDVIKLLMKESKLFPHKIVDEDLYLTNH